MRALSEPTRLAAARQEGRQEGYREGVEAAARWHDARAAQWDGRGETEQARWERVTAAQVRSLPGALSPPPAEPSAPVAEPGDWTVSDTELARDILCYLGIGSDASLEPGDRRRDRIAAMICADRERRIVKPATRITAPEAENAALRKVFDAACAMDGFGMFDDLESPSGVRMREATRRARALLQEQGEAKG
jgi:hypothetical protein